MKLLHVHIDNFGGIHDFDYSFDEGINCIYERNGWGKSTFCDFLKVMFYGFDGEKTRGELQNERKRYRPWQGGNYGGSIQFACGEERYSLTRSFGNKPSEDINELRDDRTNQKIPFEDKIGEHFLRINKESFVNTVYFSQTDISSVVTDELTGKIGNISEEDRDINSYEQAIDSLTKSMNSMSPTRKTGKIYRLNEQILAWKVQIKQATKKEEELSLYKKRETEIDKELKDYTEQRELFIRRAKKMQARGLSQEEQTEFDELEEMFHDSATDEREFLNMTRCVKKSSMLRWTMQMGVTILCLVFMMTRLPKYRNYLMIAVVVCSCLFLVKYIALRRYRRKLKGFIEKYYELTDDITNRELCRLFYEIQDDFFRYRYMSKRMMGHHPFDITYLDNIDRKIERCKKELEQVRVQYRKALDERREFQETIHQIKKSQAELEDMKAEYWILTKTRECLMEAKRRFASRYMDTLLDKFNYYYGKLEDNPLSFKIDSDFTLHIEAYHTLKELPFLSEGYLKLATLCYRMAVIESVYEDEKPFLVFDDTFSDFDTEKLQEAKRFLRELSKDYQIVYMTCHESRII